MPDRLTQEQLDRTGLSIVIGNRKKDPYYDPYCMRCSGLHRMDEVEPFYWKHRCGAICDLREYMPKHYAAKPEKKFFDWPKALRELEKNPQVIADRDRFSGFHKIKPEDLEMRFR